MKNSKVQLKEIKIIWSENVSFDDRQSNPFKSFEEFNNLVISEQNNLPSNGAYDKTKYSIVWEDGQTYDGRLDLQNDNTPGFRLDQSRVNLAPVNYLNYIIDNYGTEKGTYFTEENFTEAKQMLSNYSFEDKKGSSDIELAMEAVKQTQKALEIALKALEEVK